jgi:hypothetical protein
MGAMAIAVVAGGAVLGAMPTTLSGPPVARRWSAAGQSRRLGSRR